VKSAPVLRGGPVARAVWLVSGLFLCAVGILCFLEARLGLPPWDVLHQGIARHTPLSFGAANEVVGLIVLTIAWALGARVSDPGLVRLPPYRFDENTTRELALDLLADFSKEHAVQALSDWPLVPRIGLIVVGLICFGVGTAFYIGANLGAGPRDSLMLVGSRRTGIRIGAVRAMIEISVLLIGFLLGGTVGVGTLAFAALIGPSVEASFWLVHRVGLT